VGGGGQLDMVGAEGGGRGGGDIVIDTYSISDS